MNNSCVPSVASGRAERVAIRVKGGGGCVSKSKSEVRLFSPDGFVFVFNRTGCWFPCAIIFFFVLWCGVEPHQIEWWLVILGEGCGGLGLQAGLTLADAHVTAARAIPWPPLGLLLTAIWSSSVRCLVVLWPMLGRPLTDAWSSSDRCLVVLWPMVGLPLTDACSLW